MGDTKGLRRQWGIGLVALAVGVPLSLVTVGLAILPGLVLVPVAAGRTVARASSVPTSWLVLAVAVPAVPTVAAGVAVLGFLQFWADPLAMFLVAYGVGALAIVVCAIFFIALAVEFVLVRRATPVR